MKRAAANCHNGCAAIVVLLMLLNACGTNKTVLEEVSEKVYTLEPNADVSIQNRDGAILVYGSDTDQLRVRATKKAYTRERLGQIAIEVSRTEGSFSVSTKIPQPRKWAFSDRSGTVDYVIVLPVSTGVSTLDLNAGEVLLDGVRLRELHARLGDGRMFARNCFTNLDLTMNRGTLTVAYDWWEEEKMSARAKIAQGNAWVWAPSDAAFHLLAAVTHGNVVNDFNDVPLSAPPFADGMKVDQIINGGGQAAVEVRVEEGNIRIGEANP